MAVSIRLSRGGAKKRPYYKIVVADARTSRDGKFIERIGSYNPLLPKDSPDRVKLDSDRARGANDGYMQVSAHKRGAHCIAFARQCKFASMFPRRLSISSTARRFSAVT